MIYIGVDPGQKGGLAIIDPTGHVKVIATPIMDTGLDGIEILRFIQWFTEDPLFGTLPSVAYIERQWSRPNQNVKAMDRLMINYGEWIGFFKALRIDIRTVPARTWKKLVLNNANASKQDAIDFANKTYRTQLSTGDDGLADAIAVAHYGKLCYNS